MTLVDRPARAVNKGHQYVDDAMRSAALRVLDSHQYYMGPENDAFEAEAAAFLGARHAATVNSGSSAMFLILQALGIGPGDDVLVPAAGFVTIAEAVAAVGARPVFVDVEPETYNIDPSRLLAALTPRTKAIVPSHDYGHPADMDAIGTFARQHDLAVVEDCAHAFGATYNGRSAGTLGTASFFSFAGKSISVCGLGGMVVTDDDRVAEEVRLLRDHGRPRSGGERFYEILRVGYNLRLSELHAAIGRVQLGYLPEWNRRRQAHAAYYTQTFQTAGIPVVSPTIRPGVTHAFLHYTVRVGADVRDDLQRFLASRGVQTTILYPSTLHLLPPYRAAYGHREGDFPVAEQVTREILSLPNHPSLSEDERAYVAESVIAYFRS